VDVVTAAKAPRLAAQACRLGWEWRQAFGLCEHAPARQAGFGEEHNMPASVSHLCKVSLGVLALVVSAVTLAAEIGQLKSAKGDVWIERSGTRLPGAVGTRVQTADVVKTGADGSVGMVMIDNSLLSMGPNSALSLDRLDYDATTQRGQFDTSLSKGSLSVVSGRIAKQSPDAMSVRTPSAILGVRGTEFVVAADE
jgi:hypothetical protein